MHEIHRLVDGTHSPIRRPNLSFTCLCKAVRKLSNIREKSSYQSCPVATPPNDMMNAENENAKIIECMNAKLSIGALLLNLGPKQRMRSIHINSFMVSILA